MENNERKPELRPDPMPVGRWTINRKKCTTCCDCVPACGKGLLYEEKGYIMIRYENNCDQCGDCVAACGYGAIVLT